MDGLEVPTRARHTARAIRALTKVSRAGFTLVPTDQPPHFGHWEYRGIPVQVPTDIVDR